MQSRTSPLDCPACKQPISPAQFLGACSGYWAALEVVHFTCPLCKGTTEARLRPGVIELGYTYAAGSPHFCAMIEVPVADLEVQSGPNEVTAELDGQRWTIRTK